MVVLDRVWLVFHGGLLYLSTFILVIPAYSRKEKERNHGNQCRNLVNAVVDEALKQCEKVQGFRGKICMDTIKVSYANGVSISEAARVAADDTLFWDLS